MDARASDVPDRPVLIGMNNPISSLPEHALYPHPVGCAGWRLWKMLNEETGASRLDYRMTFERVNVLNGSKWIKAAARESAQHLLTRYSGRTMLLMGRDVARAFGVPDLLPLDCQWIVASLVPRILTCVYLVPHPSGRNLWYNDDVNRRMVSALLGRLYRDYNRGTDEHAER